MSHAPLSLKSENQTFIFVHRGGNEWIRSDRHDICIRKESDIDWIMMEGAKQIGYRLASGEWEVEATTYSSRQLDTIAIVEEYRKQGDFRDWPKKLKPLLRFVKKPGLVYDFGCGAGQVSELFHQIQAQVIGVDLSEELIAEASRICPSETFRVANLEDLRSYPGEWPLADGIWGSFMAAYFPEDRLENALKSWKGLLKANGWICLIEIDGLFSAHGPMEAEWKERFIQADKSIPGYDAFMGGNMAHILQTSGFKIIHECLIDDIELSFDGPASDAVLAAWCSRLSRPGIRGALRKVFDDVDGATGYFLSLLKSPDHLSGSKIKLVIAQLN